MKRKLSILAATLLSLGLHAQSLPSLVKAPEITTGDLPDGITYYLVKNTLLPGTADFALVQPSRPDRNGPRKDLTSLPHFEGSKPYEFLARSGVGYGGRGFIRHLRDATVFSFPGIPVSTAAVSDSSLLMLLDLARSSEYRQAIIISGDINTDALSERIRTLSMTIPARRENSSASGYIWQSQDSVAVTSATGPIGSIRVTYRAPRTEAEFMNTIQPVMSRMMAAELEMILTRRIRAAFEQAGLPLAGCRFTYTGSESTAGDELYTLTVETAPGSCPQALETIAGVLSTLDADGVSRDETEFARSIVKYAAVRDDGNYRMTNAEYVEKCISAYLYGANLMSRSDLGRMFSGRRLEIERERELLNRYIAATVKSKRNLHIHVQGDRQMQVQDVRGIYARGWSKGCSAAADIPVQSDTMAIDLPHSRVRLRKTDKDPYSGGTVWTFSNGATVIFKKTSDKGVFHYGLMVKGGWTEIPGIGGQEPSFVPDVIDLQKVSWMSGSHFKDLLAMNGITMKSSVSLSDVRFTGSAPRENLPLVMKALAASLDKRAPDKEAYRRYLDEESIRLNRDKYSVAGTRAVMDSIMCPGYVYAAGSHPSLPGDDFDSRISSYLKSKAAEAGNCVLVLAGDLDEAQALRVLGQGLAGLGTGKHRVVRPRLEYPLRQCWSSNYTTGGWREKGITMSLSALWPYGSGSYAVMNLAGTVLENELARALAPLGWCYTVTTDLSILPAEKMTLYINCRPVYASGLPSDVSPARSQQVRDAVREVINRLAGTEVSPEVLSRSKATLISRLESTQSRTDLLRDRVLDRNSLGRDVSASYKERIKTVKAPELKAVFADLDGCKCEFTVQ